MKEHCTTVTVFWKTYTQRGRGAGRVCDVSFEMPVELQDDLEELLAWSYESGASVGSSRSGIFEIQTDCGIWSSTTCVRITPASHVFKTWDQLEAEEA